MFQIEISNRNTTLNSKRVYRKSFATKRDANKWFKLQQEKRATVRNFGASFLTDNMDIQKLY